ncbi:MAG: PD40 domain-containing protein [Gammaproteobacteria bacterium]|nr:PD40 domain-containing protein [Gammaproteobacteria bacterium]
MTRLPLAILAASVVALNVASADDSSAHKAGSEAHDATAQASARPGADSGAPDWSAKELPIRIIPNIPESAEAYYAPDSYHVIAQTQDPKARRAQDEKSAGGALTWIYTDDGAKSWRVNDRGQDACSWFLPDMKRIIWTSTRDHLDMPTGNWSDDDEYPQGAELYMSNLKGGKIKRLTNNKYYEAEVSVSPNGQWVVFGRQINGNMDIWRMKIDGTEEKQLTFTPDWQEGAPFFLADNETIMYRAWQKSVTRELKRIRQETGQRNQTPMTVYTMKKDGSQVTPRTFTNDMNWAPFPAPDGRHYVFVRIVEGNNWDVFLGDLAGGEPRRLTWNPSFDGFPSISPDGKKMLFTRSKGQRFMSDLFTHVMDISSLNVGPENFKGVPASANPPAGWQLPAEKEWR